jgi:transposase
MGDVKLLSTRKAATALGVSANTIRGWAKRSLIVCEFTPGGHRRFNINSVHRAKTPANHASNLAKIVLQRETGSTCEQKAKGRTLHASTKHRSMMLRHGKFAERLVQTASRYEGSRIIRGSEAYTSKQCGACGVINDKLGGCKVFTCRSCGASADRDVHAARNILLRFLL